jgi:hypothetical protein
MAGAKKQARVIGPNVPLLAQYGLPLIKKDLQNA